MCDDKNQSLQASNEETKELLPNPQINLEINLPNIENEGKEKEMYFIC
jgi:hypothetical protein